MIAVPSGVFKHYAGVSTAILVFTKGGETNHVWFYDMKADGYTLDDKRNKIDSSTSQKFSPCRQVFRVDAFQVYNLSCMRF